MSNPDLLFGLNKHSIDLRGNQLVAASLRELNTSTVFAVSGAPATSLAQTIEAHTIEDSSASNKDTVQGYSFEWSINEKVAIEAAFGISAAGKRSAVVIKQCGFHTALDSVMNAAFHGIGGGIAVFVGDDSFAKSSTLLVDSRLLAKAAGLPCLELSARSNIPKLVTTAFEMSECASLPVIIRFTEDLKEAMQPWDLQGIKAAIDDGVLLSGEAEQVSLGVGVSDNKDQPLQIDRGTSQEITKMGRRQHHRLVKWPKIQYYVDNTDVVREKHSHECDFGVITVGGSGLQLEFPIETACTLHTDVSWPLPTAVSDFLSSHRAVTVIEQPLVFVEDELSKRAAGPINRIYGRLSGHLPPEGSLDNVDLGALLASLGSAQVEDVDDEQIHIGNEALNRNWANVEQKIFSSTDALHPFHPLFSAISDIANQGVFVSVDVGSSVKLCYPPYAASDNALCLGAPIAVAAGYSRATNKSAISVIGDYGILHSGLEAVLEMVYRKIPGLIIVLANGVTAQTGSQDTPLINGGKSSLSLSSILRGIGVSQIHEWRIDESSECHHDRLTALLEENELCVAIVHQGQGISS